VLLSPFGPRPVRQVSCLLLRWPRRGGYSGSRPVFAGRPISKDVAELVAFLASDATAFITGRVILLDGGMSAHLPMYADELDAQRA